MRYSRITLPFVAAILACQLLAATAHGQDIAPLEQRLITLRAEVEQLNSELVIAREENRTVLAGLNAQKADMAANLNRQRLTIKQIQGDLRERKEAAAAAGVAGQTLRPILIAATDRLATSISHGLPFKREERLGNLSELRDQIESGKLVEPRAANRLWAFIEDEIRITKDNAIQRQTIDLEGERMLADVAKLGTVMLLFRTDDGRLGVVSKEASQWRFEVATEPADQERIAALFDALGKQIRQGFFELPNALIAGGAQ